jgi:hypothetical protein
MPVCCRSGCGCPYPANLSAAADPANPSARRAYSIAQLRDPCSTNRCLRPVTTTHAALLRPATRPHLRLGPGPGLVSVLVSIHPRPPPFTGGHPSRVRAGRGRWRTPVNAGQHCWKACWVQALASSNLASSATLTCRNTDRRCRHPAPRVPAGLTAPARPVSMASSRNSPAPACDTTPRPSALTLTLCGLPLRRQ